MSKSTSINSLKRTKLKLMLLLIFLIQLKQTFAEELKTEPEKCSGGHSTLKNYFTWENYGVLITMLIVSCGIGFFYGFFGPKQETSIDFLLGGSSMGTLPMALSLATRYNPFSNNFYDSNNHFFLAVTSLLSNY